MIHIEIQELTRGFAVSYFDDKQPSEMDEDNVYFESLDVVLEYVKGKAEATYQSRIKKVEDLSS